MGIILHIDVNSAFLSWSALKLLKEDQQLDIRTIPAIVGGDQQTRHGIVVAKSIPAKAYGIHTAETVASAFKKCPTLVAVPPDHTYYRECSKKMVDYLKSMASVVEQASIDECYLDYESVKMKFSDPLTCAQYIKDSIKEQFGFTVNVGISDRKVLAKMASDFKKPDYIHTLYSYECKEKLWPLPIGKLHMCGKSSADLFRKMGITTIGELACMEKSLVQQWLKKHGTVLWEYANGIDDAVVIGQRGQEKSIGNSTTLRKDAEEKEEIYAILKELAQSVSERLKKKQLIAGQISTEIKYATFQSVSHQKTLLQETNSAQAIYENACQLFDELWDGNPVRLLGIRFTKLSQEDTPVQLSLFEYQKNQEISKKEKQLEEAMEKIKKKFGEKSIQKGISSEE